MNGIRGNWSGSGEENRKKGRGCGVAMRIGRGVAIRKLTETVMTERGRGRGVVEKIELWLEKEGKINFHIVICIFAILNFWRKF